MLRDWIFLTFCVAKESLSLDPWDPLRQLFFCGLESIVCSVVLCVTTSTNWQLYLLLLRRILSFHGKVNTVSKLQVSLTNGTTNISL
uniref:Uncharacterized protein n=1 Tax=Arundo donax TaxID=35708 RepID=A0A0A8YI87_ARUDO